MKNNPLTGAGYIVRGFGLITRPGLRRYVLVPLLINVVLFGGAIYFGAGQLGAFLDRLLPDWLDWLEWLLWPIFAAAAMLVIYFTFAVTANLIAAPFNGLLAEAVERSLTGRKPPAGSEGLAAMPREFARAIAGELRKLLYIALRALPLLVLFLIPGLNLAAPFLWLLFGAWMLTIEYADFPMGNHGLAFPEQRARLRARRWLSLGFGGGVMVALLIPLLNFLVIPAAVAGATALWVEQLADADSTAPTAP